MKVPTALLALTLQACPHPKAPEAPQPLPTESEFRRKGVFLHSRGAELLDCLDALPETHNRSRFKPGFDSHTYAPYHVVTFIGAHKITRVRYVFETAMEDIWQPEAGIEDTVAVHVSQWDRTREVNSALYEMYPTIIPDRLIIADPDDRDFEPTARQVKAQNALDDLLTSRTATHYSFYPSSGEISAGFHEYFYIDTEEGRVSFPMPLNVYEKVNETAQVLPLGECRSALGDKPAPRAEERKADRLVRAKARLPEVHAALLEQLKEKGEVVRRNYFIDGDDEVYYSEGFKLRVPGSGVLTSWYDEQGELMEWYFHSFVFDQKVDIHSTEEGLWALENVLNNLLSQ